MVCVANLDDWYDQRNMRSALRPDLTLKYIIVKLALKLSADPNHFLDPNLFNALKFKVQKELGIDFSSV